MRDDKDKLELFQTTVNAVVFKINNSKHRWLNWSVITYLFFGFLLALFLPVDIELDNTAIGRFCSVMMAFVPSIPNYAKISNFPNVATVFFSVMWFFSVFMIPVIFFSITGEKMYEMLRSNYWKNLPKVLFLSLFSMIIFIGFVYLFLYMPVDLAEKVKPDALMNRAKAINLVMSHSRLGLAMYGGLLIFATIIFFAAFLRFGHVLLSAIIKFPQAVTNLLK